MTGADARVRTGTEKRSAEEIAGIALRSNRDGTRLTVGDVATVRVEGVTRDHGYFVGENPAISIRVDRSAQGDALQIQDTIEQVAAQMLEGLPKGMTIDLIRARSEEISSRLNVLYDNALMGLALVVGLLFLFLNARTALWVAAGIPVAMLTALFFMWAAGLTLNMMSLFALLLTLGIIVDDAIVVGEHADFRAKRLGEHPVLAAENAARRMTAPVFSASLTTIIAFAGLMAIGGGMGDMIADIPFTVIVVLLASLVECFLILPNHLAHSLHAASKQDSGSTGPRAPSTAASSGSATPSSAASWAGDPGALPGARGLLLLLRARSGCWPPGRVPWRFFVGARGQLHRPATSRWLAGASGRTRWRRSALQDTVTRGRRRIRGESYGLNPVPSCIGRDRRQRRARARGHRWKEPTAARLDRGGADRPRPAALFHRGLQLGLQARLTATRWRRCSPSAASGADRAATRSTSVFGRQRLG